MPTSDPRLRYNWNDIVYFLELARQKSLVRAADKLRVDHTTVSRRIRGLEKSLNTSLFSRGKSGFNLTETGLRLLQYAEGMEGQANSIAETPVSRVADTPIVPSQSISKIAAVQMHVTDDSTVDDVFAMVDHAAKLGVKVVALPEYAFAPTWLPTADEAAALADDTGDLIARATDIARQYGCLIALPVVERAAQGLFVTTVLVGPDGTEIGKYRKTHLTAEERRWAVAGDAYPVFDTPFGRIGVMAGYDAVFPETSRCLGVAAADIILWPAALREPFERELIAVPRAEDNRVAVVLANRVDCPYPGGSLVIPPTGFPLWDINTVAPRVQKLGVVMPKHIDLAVCRQKQMIPKVDMFANRLVETFPPIVAA